MRILTLLPVLTIYGLVLVSCQKEISFDSAQPGTTPGSGILTRIQQGVDPDLNEDTVYLISYNSSNKISQIVDSLYEDTLKITYDASGNLKHAEWTAGDYSNYVYNGNQLLQEINYQFFGEMGRYNFEYTNGILTKCSYFTDAGQGGTPFLWSTYEFTVTAGNVSSMKAFDLTGTKIAEETLSYGTQLNPFKDLALLNTGNYMGFDELFDINAAFSKNICTGYAIGSAFGKTQFTFSSNQQPAKAILTTDRPGDLFTWQFYYK